MRLIGFLGDICCKNSVWLDGYAIMHYIRVKEQTMVGFIIAAILIVVVFFLTVIIIDGNRFVTKTYKITTDKTKHSHKFAVLSDLHGKEYGQNNDKLLTAIKKHEPTEVLMAGDMMTATPGVDFVHVLKFLGKIVKQYPVFYGNGNHEYRIKIYPDVYGDMGEKYAEGLGNIGISPLCNESTRLEEENIVIYGLEIDREYYKRGKKSTMSVDYVQEKLGLPDKSKFNILLAHNPEYFDTYAAWGADLVISGHFHGGIMRLPLLGGVIAPSLLFFPKYSGGLYEKVTEDGQKSVMVLSNGLGSHTIPVRVFNPGQLVILELDSE